MRLVVSRPVKLSEKSHPRGILVLHFAVRTVVVASRWSRRRGMEFLEDDGACDFESKIAFPLPLAPGPAVTHKTLSTKTIERVGQLKTVCLLTSTGASRVIVISDKETHCPIYHLHPLPVRFSSLPLCCGDSVLRSSISPNHG